MKSWHEWHEAWRTAFDDLNRAIVPPNFVRLPVRLAVDRETRRAEAAARREVDLVCFSYCANDEWPSMSDTVRWFAMLRVVHAMQLTVALTPCYQGRQVLVPANDVSEQTLKEWFLIFAWVAGREEWLPKLVDYALAAHTPTSTGTN